MEMGMIDVKVNFLPPDERGERECWVAECPELNLATQGDTFEEAAENIKESLHEWLRFCFENETLEEALAECGFPKNRIEKICGHLPFMYQGSSGMKSCNA